MNYRIESFLSARLFLRPQTIDHHIYFLSNLSGHISLYRMSLDGSIPQPLLPPEIALQNPHLADGKSFYVFPKIDQIIVMIDKDGDENYQPMTIPLDGGYPLVTFDNHFANYRVHLGTCDREHNIVYLLSESRIEQEVETYQGNLETGELRLIGKSKWGLAPEGTDKNHKKVILAEHYSSGDTTLYLWEQGWAKKKLIFGKPFDLREPGDEVALNGIFSTLFVNHDQSVLLGNALFEDTYGLGYLDISNPTEIKQVKIRGLRHNGMGEMVSLEHLVDDKFMVGFNIDGCDWLYEGRFDVDCLEFNVEHCICGEGSIEFGVLESIDYEKEHDRFALAFSTATTPTQIYTIEGKNRQKITSHTDERILGIPNSLLSSGEDASFTSFDGTRISARLYLPAKSLAHQAPYPLIYYIHGGPQSQERPDFAWFSMPLIQFLTLSGFAVFVPNVRGSSGYGLAYTKQVDKDWGGKDRLDHVFAVQEFLPKDKRIDVARTGVVGRSYGGYMTLMLSGRHPDLWKAAVDMFGPYDLVTFSQRIPETWKPYFYLVLGNPEIEEEKEFLIERSPRTYLDQLDCPLLVIQGKNDPRVVEAESRDLVEQLREKGKDIEFIVFENEGHDVLKLSNRITCYNAITDFFTRHL